MYTWGRGKEGQLGHNDLKDVAEPKSVTKLANRHVLDIQCGDRYTLSVCGHMDYDDAKVERELERARQKFKSVVGMATSSAHSSGHSPDQKDLLLMKQKLGCVCKKPHG